MAKVRKHFSGKANNLWKELAAQSSTESLKEIISATPALQKKLESSSKTRDRNARQQKKLAAKLVEAEIKSAEAEAKLVKVEAKIVEDTAKVAEQTAKRAEQLVVEYQEALTEETNTQKADEADEEALAEKEDQARRARYDAKHQANIARKKTIAKNLALDKPRAKLRKAFQNLKDDISSAFRYSEGVSLDDYLDLLKQLKGCRLLYKKVEVRGTLSYYPRLFTWATAQLEQVRGFAINNEKNRLAEDEGGKSAKLEEQEAVAELKSKLDLYKQSGNKKGAEETKKSLYEMSRFKKISDASRTEDGVINLRKGLFSALKWVGRSVGEGVGAGALGAGGAIKGKALGYINKNPDSTVVKAMLTIGKGVGAISKGVGAVGKVVKAVSVDSFKWISKTLSTLGRSILGFIKRPFSAVGGFGLGNLIGLAALGGMVIAPLLETLDKTLADKFGNDYISNFADKAWSVAWKWIKDQIGITAIVDSVTDGWNTIKGWLGLGDDYDPFKAADDPFPEPTADYGQIDGLQSVGKAQQFKETNNNAVAKALKLNPEIKSSKRIKSYGSAFLTYYTALQEAEAAGDTGEATRIISDITELHKSSHLPPKFFQDIADQSVKTNMTGNNKPLPIVLRKSDWYAEGVGNQYTLSRGGAKSEWDDEGVGKPYTGQLDAKTFSTARAVTNFDTPKTTLASVAPALSDSTSPPVSGITTGSAGNNGIGVGQIPTFSTHEGLSILNLGLFGAGGH